MQFPAKLGVAEIVAQEQGTEQLAKLLRGPINRIPLRCATESLQRDDGAELTCPDLIDATSRSSPSQPSRMGFSEIP